MSEVCEQITMKVDDGLTSHLNTDLRTNTLYDFDSLKNEKAFEKAQQENLDIVFPKDNELQIDIDNEHSYILFLNQLTILAKYLQLLNVEEHPSKGGSPGRHITVRLGKSFTPLERLALQAMLGSDRIRELLGFIRLYRGEQHPTLFFERKTS